MQVNELKSLLSRFHIRPNKLLGQNFLLSDEVLDKIITAAQLTREDTVLEIGPGLGFLTQRLAEQAGKVIAIEKDRKLAKTLRKFMKKYENVKIIEDDALVFNPQTYNLQLTTYKLIANIPYYLTGKILQKFLTGGSLKVSVTSGGNVAETFRSPSLMALLLQKEVAERIIAKPGEMSILAVSVQFYAEPEIIDFVLKENFYPVPEVDSTIVRLTPPLMRGGEGEGFRPRFEVDEKKFFQLVKIGFSNKRKQLQNNLKGVMGIKGERGDLKKILVELKINPLARAEDLSLEEWNRLYRKLT